ncbi:TadE/TadG family type IV pilus assembly protein [Noviherbaspirillum sp. ST9]|uniref:TadE/TadG family type IV pilus assembly protein n=1 Tax=Noviherbaspirillum sp. ST9 TaxID=3401606 RepID=UPI003B588997
MNAMHIFRPVLRAPQSDQRGAIVVELTFVTIVLLLVMAGAFGFGRTFWYADALAKAARDGARVMSVWPAATIASGGITAAQDQVVAMANAANVVPPLTTANVVVECMDVSFAAVPCADGVEPEYVRVTIAGFSVAVDAWLPVLNWTGVLALAPITLSPQTLMRYML